MLFNSFIFLFLFLPVTYTVFWLLKSARSRYVWLSLTGYVFYGYWDWRFCFLMAFSTIVSYSAGLGMLKWDADPRKRKLCLVIPVTVDLALLGFFKYANFGLGAFRDAMHAAGLDLTLPHLDIILPVGISFYTFHTISYIVDAYRRQITPTRNFWEFSSYVSLFSQLVAGPIVRFKQVQEDFDGIAHASRTRWLREGLTVFSVGLVEKVVVADTLAAFVNPLLSQWQSASAAALWVAMFGYSFQLYFDFSGYSSMAVGLGYLFGIRIPRNFNSPYKSLDPSEFWRRWHISLSTCMRDYLYIPFGGNRGTTLQVYRNLMLTMLIGGLWHGAGWTFIIWGCYHGVLLSAHRAAGDAWDALPARLRQFGMFFLAMIGWVFFRSDNLTMAGGVLSRMFSGVTGIGVPQEGLSLIALAIAAVWGLFGPNIYDLDYSPKRWKAIAGAVAFGVALALIAGDRTSPFLYFQF
ncbi:MAG: Peptidoglycan O-acetyltransferase [Gemmatimonadaceae bacterium]|nr:Peptidoglycan O-acetyltransferase [Gemmatimonadaceae bacterium]